MLSSLLLGEELRVIGKHNWDGATNAVELKRKVTELEKVASVPITKDSVICDFFLFLSEWLRSHWTVHLGIIYILSSMCANIKSNISKDL